MSKRSISQFFCNSNVFLAEILKLLYEKKVDDKHLLTAEKNKLVKLLSFAVLDDEGNHLNPKTINTDLKPSNVTKRPGV